MDLRALYFYTTTLGFLAGVFAASATHIFFQSSVAISVCALTIAIFLIFHSRLKNRPLAHPILALALFVLVFAVGSFRMESREKYFENDSLRDLLGQVVTFVGTIEDDTEANDSSATLRAYALSYQGETRKINAENVLLRFPGERFRFGDNVALEGRLMLPENFETKSGKTFDYVSYLKNKGVVHTIERPKVIEREEGEASLISSLYSLKRLFMGNVNRNVPEPAGALATGVTIAGKGALPSEVKDDFIDAGLIHIVVLSGYNIAIVVSAMMWCFSFLGRRWSSIIALLGILIFVVISGGAAPVVRAGIMAAVVLVGALSYTKVIQNRALFFAATVMVLWNPLILTSDASFALSFLATFAIVNIVPTITPYLRFVPERLKLRQMLSETLSAQVFVLPYLLYEIGRLSIVAPLSNIIVLPFIPAIMLLCFIVGTLGFSTFLVLPFAGALYLVSMLVINLAHMFASLPFAAIDVTITLPTMIGIYALYFGARYYFVASSKRATETS